MIRHMGSVTLVASFFAKPDRGKDILYDRINLKSHLITSVTINCFSTAFFLAWQSESTLRVKKKFRSDILTDITSCLEIRPAFPLS